MWSSLKISLPLSNFSPFQLPPKSPFNQSEENLQESDPFSSHLNTDEILFSPIDENCATNPSLKPEMNIENINDEDFGRKLIIEKHLEHQMILKKHNLCYSPYLLDANNERSHTLENQTYSIDDFSNTFANKGNSEIYKPNGMLRLPKNLQDDPIFGIGKIKATTKELRKLKQENFLVEELFQAREAGEMFRKVFKQFFGHLPI